MAGSTPSSWCALPRRARGRPGLGGGLASAHSNAAAAGLQTASPRVRSVFSDRPGGLPAMPTIPADVLTEFTAALFRDAGVPESEARSVSASLVGANLRGHDS